jgi:hypothetical protein
VQFSDAFLRSLLVAGLLRYLAVAHFGRGRGGFVEGEAPAFWQAEVEREIAGHDATLPQAMRGEPAVLAALLEKIMASVLDHLYRR